MLKNIFANILGRFWSILSNYLFIPVYISLLGIENYSIISFSFILIGIMSVMDAGLTATLSREFAKHSEMNSSNNKIRILNTLEVCYWTVVIIVISVITILARPIAEHWLTLKHLDINYVALSLKIFGIGMAFQLLTNFYIGGLIGIERQVVANVYLIIWGLLRNGLVIFILYYKPSLIYFFSWQTMITLLFIVFLRYNLIKRIKNIDAENYNKFIFDKSILKNVGRFVGGMLLISLVAAINTQLDKIAISKLLPIEELGYYNLGISLTQVLLVLVSPISIALLPRFTLLFSLKKYKEIDELFFSVLLVVSIIVFCTAATIMFNSKELILVWTGNITLAISSSNYIFFLAIGTAMLAMQLIPFNIAIANGYTKINNMLGLASLIVSIPGYWLSVYYFGPKGAAITWCFIQSIITPIYLFYIHKKFLNGSSYSKLISNYLVKPAFTAILIGFLLRQVLVHSNNRVLELFIICLMILINLILVSIFVIPKKELNNYKFIIINRFSTIKIFH